MSPAFAWLCPVCNCGNHEPFCDMCGRTLAAVAPVSRTDAGLTATAAAGKVSRDLTRPRQGGQYP